MSIPKTSLAHAWVQQVSHCADSDLPDYVRRGILSCGDSAGKLLGDLLIEPATWDTRVAEHAIVLLGELRHEPALGHLTDLLWDEPEYQEEDHNALMAFGDEAIPYLVRGLRNGFTEVAYTLVQLAAGKGRADVREVFEEVLEAEPDAVVDVLAALGDSGLVPAMLAALRRLDETDPLLAHTIVDLVDAITALGGDPGELGAEKAHAVRV